MAMSNRKIKANLIMAAISFLVNFTAYLTLEGLQSSLNSETGLYSVSAIYGAFVVTSLFLPTLAMDFLQSRKAMGFSILSYPIYTLANCYPRSYTLILAGIVLGSGASVIWSASRVYISDLAIAYARQNDSEEEKTAAHFFGIFWAIFSLCSIAGNIVSSVVLQSFAMEDSMDEMEDGTPTSSNTTFSAMAFITTTAQNSEIILLGCGMHNCDKIPENSTILPREAINSRVNPVVLYALFGSFIAMQIGASLILLFLVDDAPKLCRRDQTTIVTNPASCNIDSITEWHQVENLPKKDIENVAKTITSERTSGKSSDTKISSAMGELDKHQPTRIQRIKNQALVTGKLIIFNHNAKLLIPISLHVGLLQGYALGQFTRHWVTCVLGIEFIGYTASVFGLGSVIGGYGVGIATQFVGRWLIALIAFFAELGLGAGLLIWEPEIVSYIWIFCIIFGSFGILHSAKKTLLTTAYSILFASDKEAASSSFSIWDPMGVAVAYAISSQICNRTFTAILLALDGIGTVLYLIAEGIYAKNQQASQHGDSTPQ